MTLSRASLIVAAVLSGLLVGGGVRAQTALGAGLLSDTERRHYAELLSKANDSAARAKIKSEMNRLIQTRRLEQRTTQSRN